MRFAALLSATFLCLTSFAAFAQDIVNKDTSPPASLIKQLESDVMELGEQGRLDQDETQALTAKLDGALMSLQITFTKGVLSQLKTFIKDVEAMVRSGRLSEEEASPLIKLAKKVIEPIDP